MSGATPSEATAMAVREHRHELALFRTWFLDTVRESGWQVHDAYLADHSHTSFPRFILVRLDEIRFVQLLAQGRELTPQQAWWINAMRVVSAANQTMAVHVWEPTDRPEIEEVLNRAA